jgi:hypothetical protein
MGMARALHPPPCESMCMPRRFTRAGHRTSAPPSACVADDEPLLRVKEREKSRRGVGGCTDGERGV